MFSTTTRRLLLSINSVGRPLSTSIVVPLKTADGQPPAHNIEVRVLRDKQTEWKMILKLWLDYFAESPLFSTVKGFRTEAGRKSLEGLLKYVMMFDDTPCVVTWDTVKDQAAGFIVSQTFYRYPTPEQAKPPMPFGNHSWDEDTLQRIIEMEEFRNSLSEKSKIFNDLNVNKIWKVQCGGVSPEYRKQGIAGILTNQTILEAQNSTAGYDAIVVEPSSLYSCNILRRLGFQVALELDYSKLYPSDTKITDNKTDLKARVMVKKLKN